MRLGERGFGRTDHRVAPAVLRERLTVLGHEALVGEREVEDRIERKPGRLGDPRRPRTREPREENARPERQVETVERETCPEDVQVFRVGDHVDDRRHRRDRDHVFFLELVLPQDLPDRAPHAVDARPVHELAHERADDRVPGLGRRGGRREERLDDIQYLAHGEVAHHELGEGVAQLLEALEVREEDLVVLDVLLDEPSRRRSLAQARTSSQAV